MSSSAWRIRVSDSLSATVVLTHNCLQVTTRIFWTLTSLWAVSVMSWGDEPVMCQPWTIDVKTRDFLFVYQQSKNYVLHENFPFSSSFQSTLNQYFVSLKCKLLYSCHLNVRRRIAISVHVHKLLTTCSNTHHEYRFYIGIFSVLSVCFHMMIFFY